MSEAFEENVAFPDHSTVLAWRNTQSTDYSKHWHTATEVIIPLINSYDVWTPAKQYHLEPQEILIIPSGEIHSLSPTTMLDTEFSGLRYIYLLDLTFLARIKGFSTLMALLTEPLCISPETHGGLHRVILNYMIEIEREFYEHKTYYELNIYAALLKIFSEFGYYRAENDKLFSSCRNDKKKEYVEKLNLVLEYIDKHYMDEISLDEMAKLAGFSKYHFSRLFTEYTGHTFLTYLNLQRIKATEKLLANDTLSITEIALQCGFPSISTFNRLFKNQKNCSPSEYRELFFSQKK